MSNPFVKTDITKGNWQLLLNEFNKNNQQVNDLQGNVDTVNVQLADKTTQLTDITYNVKYPPPPLVAAKCDGVSDDTAAINALIQYVASQGGGSVILPKGTIKANILINVSNVTLKGSFGGNLSSDPGGMGGTILVPFDVNKPILSVGDGTAFTSYVRLKDLYLSGVSTSDGLWINGASHVFGDGVNILQCKDNIHITSSAARSSSGIYLNNFSSYYAYQNCIYAEWGTSYTTAFFVSNYRIVTDQTKGNAVKLSGTVTLNTDNGYIDTVLNKGIIISGGANIIGSNTIVDLANKTKGAGISVLDKAATTPISNLINGNIILNNATIGFTDKQVDGIPSGMLPSSMYSLYPKTIGSADYLRNGDIDGAVNGRGQVYKDDSTNNMLINNTKGGVMITPEDIDSSVFLVRKYNSMPVFRLQRTGGLAEWKIDISDPNNKRVVFSCDWGINFQFPNDYGGNHLMIDKYHLWVDSQGRLRIKPEKPTSTTDGIVAGSQVGSGTTANRPTYAFVGQHYFDTTLGKPVWTKTAGTLEVDTLTISAGATTAGNIAITLNGVAKTVAVAAGDTAGAIGDKIRAAVFAGWTVGGTAGTSTVTFTKLTAGTNTSPTFADTDTTGTSASFAVTTAGTNNVWVDSTGTTV